MPIPEMPTLRALAAVALLVALPRAAVAESLPTWRDITSVRAMGKAGASIGYGGDTDAIHANPAAVAAQPTFNLLLGGIVGIPQSHYVLTVEAVDSKINEEDVIPVSGGLSYQYYLSGEGFEERKGHVVSLSIAVPAYTKYAYVGVTTRYLHFAGNVVSNSVTMDAGLMIKPIPLMGIGLAGYNLIDVRSAEAKRAWGFGLSVGKENWFHVDLDARLDPDATDTLQPTFTIGGEYLIADLVAPRLGYSEDLYRGAHLICAGVSIIYQGWAIEVAYKHAVLGDEKTFALGLRLLDF